MKKNLLTIVLATVLLSACGSSQQTVDNNLKLDGPMTTSPNPTPTLTTQKKNTDTANYAAITTKDGQIVVKLYAKETPNTVANFLKKADSGFYNNLTFHRVIPGFMAQGGDPTGTGMGGNRQKSELNSIPFKRGTLGLARTAETKDFSNDSQFFICFTDDGCQHLTGEYVNFGEVVSGLDVLDKIIQGDKMIQISSKTK